MHQALTPAPHMQPHDSRLTAVTQHLDNKAQARAGTQTCTADLSPELESCAEGPDASEEVQEEQEEDVFKDAGDQLGVAAEAAHIAHDDVARGGFEGAVDSQGPASSSGRTKVHTWRARKAGSAKQPLREL